MCFRPLTGRLTLQGGVALLGRRLTGQEGEQLLNSVPRLLVMLPRLARYLRDVPIAIAFRTPDSELSDARVE